jgi:hypothetical protein
LILRNKYIEMHGQQNIKILLVPSIPATCFGDTDHPRVLNI